MKNKSYFIKLSIWLIVFFLLGNANGYFNGRRSGFREFVKWSNVVIGSQNVTPEVIPTPTPVATPKTQREEMESLIREIFGTHSDDAFLLLEGRGPNTCAENRNLDPTITHTNDDGSIDYGLFMINDYWFGFNKPVNNPRFLNDPDINVRIAWRIYVSNGYSFNRWTCGRIYGI